MVGRKTSGRCTNCQRRKIKCDLSRPSCTQCIKSEWACPGYDTSSRFVSEEPDRGKKQRQQCGVPRGSNTLQLTAKNNDFISPWAFLVDPANTLRNEFIQKLTNGAIAARFIVIPEQQLLQHIPRRLGHSFALDDAVRLICKHTAMMQSASKAPINPQTARLRYLSALRSLQNALHDQNSAMTSETLAAATLLQMYEHFVDSAQSIDSAQGGWRVHADGVITMLRLRGPARIQNEIDRAVLHAQTGNIFSEAIRNKTTCFLAEPEWKAVLKSAMTPELNTGREPRHQTASPIEICLPLPNILSRFHQLHACGVRRVAATEELHGQVDDLHSLRGDLVKWWTHNVSKGIVPSSATLDSVHSVRMRAASLVAVSAFLAIVNYMLVDLIGHAIDIKTDAWSDYAAHIATLASQCQLAALNMTRYFESLKAIDTAVAGTCSILLKMVLARVLDAPWHECVESDHLKAVLLDLSENLTECDIRHFG